MMMSERCQAAGMWVAVTLAIALVPTAVAGQGVRRDECPPGEALTADLGISSLECQNCTLRIVNVREDVAAQLGRHFTPLDPTFTFLWRFRSEPVIRAVREDGPAEGLLEPGDVIVAIDGDLITTGEAGYRFSNAEIGRPVVLTIRRDGDLSRVKIRPVARCERLPVPPEPPEVPRSPRPAPDAIPAPLPRPERAPAPPPPVFPSGWLGFGIRCGDCEIHAAGGEAPSAWVFREPPEVFSVEEGSPAALAGLRSGDLLLSIDGVALTSEEGGRRFGAVRAGQTVALGYRRDARVDTVRLTATERKGPQPAQPPAAPRLRYVGTLGDVDIEVHGSGSVIVTVVEPGRELEIVTADSRIRLRRSQ